MIEHTPEVNFLDSTTHRTIVEKYVQEIPSVGDYVYLEGQTPEWYVVRSRFLCIIEEGEYWDILVEPEREHPYIRKQLKPPTV